MAHSQALHLRELDFAARSDLFIAIAHAGDDNTYRFRIIFSHSPDLTRAGLRAQNDVRLRCIKAILHLARRMVRRKIEESLV